MRNLLALFLVFTVGTTSAQEFLSFLDTVGHKNEEHITILRQKNVVEGYGYDIFRPDISINRAEFLKIVMLAAFGDEEYDPEDRRCFADFVGAEQWFWVHACEARIRGVIDGYNDNTFRGTQVVNLAEAIKIIVDAWEIRLPMSATGYDNWYDPYMIAAFERGVFDEYFLEEPAHLMTRGEMAALIVEMVGEEEIATVAISIPEPEPFTNGVCGNGLLEGDEECDDGNLENGDGCSKICILVPEPIRHAALLIDQQEFGSVSVAQGSKDIVLLSFDAVSGRQNAIFTSAMFTATSGDLTSAENYRLRNGNKEIVGTVAPTQNIVTFAGIDSLIEEGIAERFELIADISVTAPESTLALGFAVSESGFVEAHGEEDGFDLTGITVNTTECNDSTCWIRVSTAASRSIEISSRGNLFVTIDPIPVSEHQLLAESTTPVLFRFQLRADGEDITVTDIAIADTGDTVEYLELFRDSELSPFTTATLAGCADPSSGQFCARGLTLNISNDSEVTISVKAKIQGNPEDVSGKSLSLYLTSGTSPQPAIEAYGTGSQDVLSQNNGDSTLDGEIFIGRDDAGPNSTITGVTHRIATPTIFSIENASSDSDGSPIPLGDSTFGVFRFSAPNHSGLTYDVNLETLVFTVAAQNIEFSPGSFSLYNTSNSSNTLGCSESGVTGSITVTCSGIEGGLTASIGPGGSMTFGLRGEIVNASVDDGSSALQAQLQNLGSSSTPGTVIWNDGTTQFNWVDVPYSNVKSTLYQLQ